VSWGQNIEENRLFYLHQFRVEPDVHSWHCCRRT